MSTELTTPIKIEIPGIGTIESADLYLKSEVDKVIADLKESHKKEVEQLLIEIVKLKDKLSHKTEFAIQCQMAAHTLQRKLRHCKYKRCMAMANMCREAVCFWDNVKYTYFKGEAYCFRKLKHNGKWGQIWLAISEKFKPNSTAR